MMRNNIFKTETRHLTKFVDHAGENINNVNSDYINNVNSVNKKIRDSPRNQKRSQLKRRLPSPESVTQENKTRKLKKKLQEQESTMTRVRAATTFHRPNPVTLLEMASTQPKRIFPIQEIPSQMKHSKSN